MSWNFQCWVPASRKMARGVLTSAGESHREPAQKREKVQQLRNAFCSLKKSQRCRSWKSVPLAWGYGVDLYGNRLRFGIIYWRNILLICVNKMRWVKWENIFSIEGRGISYNPPQTALPVWCFLTISVASTPMWVSEGSSSYVFNLLLPPISLMVALPAVMSF